MKYGGNGGNGDEDEAGDNAATADVAALPLFHSGWLTGQQRMVLLSQFKNFYKTVGVDQKIIHTKALQKLNNMDRTKQRNEAFDEADISKDELISIEEVKILFRRRPKIRRNLFVLLTDDILHNITSVDRAGMYFYLLLLLIYIYINSFYELNFFYLTYIILFCKFLF